MGPVAYTVTAELPDEGSLREYLAWLTHGHIQDVIAGGASEAQVIGPLPAADPLPQPPFRVESRYIFPTLDAFRAYETIHAPRLRAQGLSRFGPERGIRMTRSLGLLADRAGARG